MDFYRRCAPVQYDAFEPQLIAGYDRPAKAGLVDAAEEEELLLAIGHVAQAEDGRALRHRFDDQHAGHDRISGKVSLKELLVRRDVLQADDSLSVLDLEHAIDEQHRVAMRQQFHDFGNGEHFGFPSSVIQRPAKRGRRISSYEASAGTAHLEILRPSARAQDDKLVLFLLAILLSVASRLANSRNGIAGIPITFAPSGTSSST